MSFIQEPANLNAVPLHRRFSSFTSYLPPSSLLHVHPLLAVVCGQTRPAEPSSSWMHYPTCLASSIRFTASVTESSLKNKARTSPLNDPSLRAYILTLGSPSSSTSIAPHSPDRRTGSSVSVSRGRFVTYTAMFLGRGDLGLWSLLFKPFVSFGRGLR